jgi:hypothetical protein
MRQVPITFAATSAKGERASLSGGRTINAIVEQLGNGQMIVKRAPGLRRFFNANGPYSHCRGMIKANDATLLMVYDGRVQSVTLSGGVAGVEDRGALAGSDIVTLARNNNLPTQDIVCVSPANGAFILSATGAPAPYPDSDVGFPNSVCFLDGYFFFTYGDGRVIASDLNSTAINPLDVAKAQSSPEGLLRGVAHRSMLLLCGPATIEVWQDTANPTGFPFSRVTVIPRGLIARNAIAGWEQQFASVIMWVATDNIVYRLDGYAPTRISTHDVEHDIQALADKEDLRAFVFANNGHHFWVLKSSKWCWVYDVLTSTWQERSSYLAETWRAEQSCFWQGDWVLGDYASGAAFRPSNDVYSEDSQPLVFDVTSVPTQTFPGRFSVPRAEFEFMAGPGVAAGALPMETDPRALVSWSDDGGATYSMAVERLLGQQGKYNQRIVVTRSGFVSPYGRQWRLVVSDPVFVGLMGGSMSLADRVF